MGLFLNLAWLSISVLLGIIWIRSNRHALNKFGWSTVVALLLLVLLLFPAISMTDDLSAITTASEMRPVVMACLAAGLGLLPAALSNGIGAQAQQPLARVVVGGMITTIIAVLFILPLFLRQKPHPLHAEEVPAE